MCYEFWRERRKQAEDTERARREAEAAIEKVKQSPPAPMRERRVDRPVPATR